MRKLSPTKIRDDFITEVNRLLAFYTRALTGFRGLANEKSDSSLLAEQVFLFAAISFESVLSDLFFAYVNIDASKFMEAKEQKAKAIVGSELGSWYESRIVLPGLKHIKADQLRTLLDPRGYNITFKNARNMVSQARKNLIFNHQLKYRALTSQQRKFIDATRCLRNFIAHRSESGFKSMTSSLASLSGGTFDSLSRGASAQENKVNSVGAYLKAKKGGSSRVDKYLRTMKDIVTLLGS